MPTADAHPTADDGPGPPDGESPLEDLPLLISRLHHHVVALVQRSLAEHGLDTVGLKPGMGVVLYALFEQDDQIISQLARRVRLANSTVTGLLEQMERAELIVRERDAQDGRAIRVRLTDRARAIETPCREMHAAILATLHGSIEQESIRQTRETLARLLASLRAGDEEGS